MRGTHHSQFVGSRHPLRIIFCLCDKNVFFSKSTSQPASHSGGAAMRLCFIPGRMFPILVSSGHELILILIVFNVFIDFPFGVVTVFNCCCGIFFSFSARSCAKCSDFSVSKNSVLSKVPLSQADFFEILFKLLTILISFDFFSPGTNRHSPLTQSLFLFVPPIEFAQVASILCPSA